ncbi:MAG: hypothetical protein M3Q97_01820, partial [Bacteroidota bacterium]|nr:hypothetical protein [Bacteroidota bacterium]
MKKITFLLCALIISVSNIQAQPRWDNIAEPARSYIKAWHKAIPKGARFIAGSANKTETLKRLNTVAVVEWNDSTAAWNEDTTMKQTFSWHSDGTLESLTADLHQEDVPQPIRVVA